MTSVMIARAEGIGYILEKKKKKIVVLKSSKLWMVTSPKNVTKSDKNQLKIDNCAHFFLQTKNSSTWRIPRALVFRPKMLLKRV